MPSFASYMEEVMTLLTTQIEVIAYLAKQGGARTPASIRTHLLKTYKARLKKYPELASELKELVPSYVTFRKRLEKLKKFGILTAKREKHKTKKGTYTITKYSLSPRFLRFLASEKAKKGVKLPSKLEKILENI